MNRRLRQICLHAHRNKSWLIVFQKRCKSFQRFIIQSVVYHDLVPICVDCYLKQDCLDGLISATGVNIFMQPRLGS